MLLYKTSEKNFFTAPVAITWRRLYKTNRLRASGFHSFFNYSYLCEGWVGMFKDKKVVVVMPGYNAAGTLCRTYDEAVAQGVVD